MSMNFAGRNILILVSNGVDESIMSSVQRELVKTGATVKAVGTETGLVNSWNSDTAIGSWGLYFPVDQQIGQTLGADFDFMVVPSGARSIQKLGANPHAERILSGFLESNKPVALIGDAVELLAKTSLAKNWKVSGPEKSQQILKAAGAEWQVEAECVHGPLLTGTAADAAAFIQRVFAHFTASAGDESLRAAA